MLYVHKALKMAIIKHAQVYMGFNKPAVPFRPRTYFKVTGYQEVGVVSNKTFLPFSFRCGFCPSNGTGIFAVRVPATGL